MKMRTSISSAAALHIAVFTLALAWFASGGVSPASEQNSGATSKRAEVTGPVAAAQLNENLVYSLAGLISEDWRIPLDQSANLVRKSFKAAAEHSLDPLLVLAVIAQESSFRNFGNAHAWLRDKDGQNAINPLAAHGPMQVAGRWHLEKMPRDEQGNVRITSVEENVRVGAWILKEYLQRDRGDLPAALQRYNGNRADPEKRYANGVLTKLGRLEQALH
ncbi:transglycosylase SLT domain-containing protein [Hydrogenophaga sp. 2FB]|uniref:transglycosylase SLT domain-containing protein n=1 Tax=Hydrogenophaga sp. 2FB TaxID=2502187 RepID=UPI0010F5EEB5|nr:transglycosylase SLT domain-containing protein [Hydrogenophaga sp. 2FB]